MHKKCAAGAGSSPLKDNSLLTSFYHVRGGRGSNYHGGLCSSQREDLCYACTVLYFEKNALTNNESKNEGLFLVYVRQKFSNYSILESVVRIST